MLASGRGVFASPSQGLFHNVTNSSPVPAKITEIIKSQLPIQTAAPEQRLGLPVQVSWLLALVFFSIHSLVLTTALQIVGQAVALRANDKGCRKWQ